MKFLPILIFSFLLQSCFSYKSVNYSDINNEKKQKFEVSKLDKTEVKVRLISINENKMILEHKGQNKTILKDEIYDLRVKRFSVLKTLTGVGSSYVFMGIGAGAILLLSGFP